MKIKAFIIFLLLVVMPIVPTAAVNIDNVSIPDFNYGTFTRYWYNPDNQQFDAFGFGYSLIAPFTSLMGAWFFLFLWSAIVYRSYEKTGNITMPVVVGILTSTVWGVLIPQEGAMVWQIMLGIGIAVLIAKYMIDR